MYITEQLCSLPKTLPDGGLALYAWPVSSTGIFARGIKSNYRELGIICKGRKSFENQVSQFLLLKDRLVCNTVCRRCTFACACLYRHVGVCAQHMHWRRRSLLWFVSPKRAAFIPSCTLCPFGTTQADIKKLPRQRACVCEGVWVTHLHIQPEPGYCQRAESLPASCHVCHGDNLTACQHCCLQALSDWPCSTINILSLAFADIP